MKIDIQELAKIKDRLKEINSVELQDIEWFDGNNKIDITPEEIEDWSFVGLSNFCFFEFMLDKTD